MNIWEKHRLTMAPSVRRTEPSTGKQRSTAQAQRTGAWGEHSKVIEKPPPCSFDGDGAGSVTELEQDMASCAGLSLAEKATIKAGLLKKYRERLERLPFSGPLSDDDRLLVNGYAIWLFDTGDIDAFIDITERAAKAGLPQTVIPNKDYRLLKLYWVMDWAAKQRDAGLSYEPCFSQVFDSVNDWNLPKRIREGYHYFKFYSLLAMGELPQALEFGERAIDMGAEIKTNYATLRDILSGKVQKEWNAETWRFEKTH